MHTKQGGKGHLFEVTQNVRAPRRAVHVLLTRMRVAGCKTCDGACFGFWGASFGGLGVVEAAPSLGSAD
jgi:hypothetical protein